MTKTLMGLIVISFLLSCMMSLLPLPPSLLELNPSWCLLTLLFWTYRQPRMVNIAIAWCIGLLMDGLTDSLLGSHALAFVIVVFLFDLFYRRFYMFHVLQQSLVIGILVACSFMIIFFVNHLLLHEALDGYIILSAITSACCWPFYCLFGKKIQLIKG